MNRFFIIFCLLLLGGCVAGDFGAVNFVEHTVDVNKDSSGCNQQQKKNDTDDNTDNF